MNIGFAFDLRQKYLDEGFDQEDVAEFDKPETIDAIAASLEKLGHRVDRIGHARQLAQRLVDGGRWDLVFNITEGLHGFGREAQVPALLDIYRLPYVFSDSLTMAVCLHKGYAKRIVRDLGLPTPAFAVVDGPEPPGLGFEYPLFVKPVAEGTGKGVGPEGKVSDPDSFRRVAAFLLDKFRQPVLAEEFLPGREFTVGVVGTGRRARVLGVMEVLLLGSAEPNAYSYVNKDEYESRVEYRLISDAEAEKAAATALAAYRGLGCRDAGRVDLRSDASGTPCFMEINPLAGLNPVHSDLPILCRLTGISFDRLIAMIMESALERGICAISEK